MTLNAVAMRTWIFGETAPNGTARARLARSFRCAFTVNLVAAALGVTIYVAFLALHPQPDRLYDFRTLWGAGQDVLNGDAGGFIYPPPVALAMVPFALLPFSAAAPIYLGILLLSVILTLFVLDVRDPRCYALALLSWPMLSSLGNGAITTLLALGLALTWRYRDRLVVATGVLAATVVAKLFLWPLWVWLLATRRYRTAAAVGLIGVSGGLAAWALIGFAGLRDYPDLLGRLAALVQSDGYSPIALGLALGMPLGAARAVAVALGVAILVALFVLARREDGDRRSFVLAIVASLVFSPIVWLHYFVLLLVPVALASRRLSAAWFIPVAYFTSGVNSEGDVSTILTVWAITFVIVLFSLRTGPPRRRVFTAAALGSRSHQPARSLAT